ncbi:MAG: hypothetical protein SPH06_01960 [Erysipelotrichaceae bacterium]|nr:hypothetical protein [Erysipelotrichaceae bacterium]
MLLNDVVIKKNNKELLFEVLLILLFVGFVFFTRNNVTVIVNPKLSHIINLKMSHLSMC